MALENNNEINRDNDLERKVNNLDNDIKNLDDKVQSREDFSNYNKELQRIADNFKTLDSEINSIKNKDRKENLLNRLNNLKIAMIDLFSDWNINNVINWKTKDVALNSMVWSVDEIFWKEMENLLNNIKWWAWSIVEMLSDKSPMTEARLTEITNFWWIPHWKLSVEWQEYFWFQIPWSWEIYALVDWKLKMCEWVLDDISWTNKTWNKVKKHNWPSLSHSEKLIKGSKDNITWRWVKDTRKLSQNLWNWVSAFAYVDSDWTTATPGIWGSYKWFDAHIGKTKMNTQITAYYSPWIISWAYDWWRKDKEVYKWKLQQNFKFKKFSFSIAEIFKTSDFSKIRSSNLSTELRASYKPYSNLSLSAISNLDYKLWNTFTWIWATYKF